MDQVLSKSKLYKLLIEINDPEVVKQELSNKITEELINIILNLDIKYLFENLKLWNDLFYLQIDNIEEIREKFIQEIYENYNFIFNLDETKLYIKKFITDNTCINCNGKCKDSVESIEKEHFDCLKYFCKNESQISPYACSIATKKGKLKLLKYAHENKCPWNRNTCSAAAQGGNLDCLKYAHENGCPWDNYTTYYALKYNKQDCLQYALDNGCPT